MEMVQKLAVNNSIPLLAHTKTADDAEGIELANAFTAVSLEIAVRALRDPTARLGRPAMLPPIQVTALLVQAFHGRKLTKRKINSLLAQANLRIPMTVLQDALDRLVQQGKVERQEREGIKKPGRGYTLYSFGRASLKSEVLLALRLNDLLKQFGGEAFELGDFLHKAVENEISREQAQSWLDAQKMEGSFFEFAHNRFRRVF